jgi:hypothetical protein
MSIGQELLKELETEIRNVLEIPSEWLPENYRGKRKTRKLSSVYSQLKRSDKNFDRDPRAVRGSAERQAVLDRYAKMAEQNLELEFDSNEDALYNNQLTFCGAMVKAGLMDQEDFDNE